MSTTVVSIYVCRTIEGKSYLVADYSLECHTSTWYAWMAWSSVYVVVYVAGLPIVTTMLLCCAQDSLHSYTPEKDRAPIAFVTKGYELKRRAPEGDRRGARPRPRTCCCWRRGCDLQALRGYWEVVEMLRKLMLTGGSGGS